MTRLRKTVRIRGLTLVELAIASFLFLLVLGLTSAALSSGVKSYLSVRSEVELQQDALAILSRITREVGEADPGTTWPPPTADTTLIPPGPDPVGIVFSSPRDGSGRLSLDPATKKPRWHKRICYLFDPSTRQLFRGTQDLAAVSATPPPLDPTLTTDWFRTNAPMDPLPGRVESFEIKVGNSTSSFDFNVVVSSSSQGYKTRVQFLGHATMNP